MIANPVYQQPPKAVLNPRASLRDAYFGYSPDELELEYMRYAMQLIDTLDHCPSLPESTRRSTVAYLTRQMEKIDSRIERYRRDDRLRYQWPDRTNYEALTEIAQEMKFRYPLERFIDDHLPVSAIRFAGNTWIGHCPIPNHEDTTPSFHVYDSVRFKCFGCEASGDVFDLIGLVYGIESFSDRVEYLAEVMP
jgi:hypothetical protein